jgi:hypothetical protein
MLLLDVQLRSLHVQFILHKNHFPRMVTLMRNLIVHLQHPKNAKETEKKIDDSLEIFIEALPHLETLHYGFKV